jgi:hypothetical protein
MQVIAITLLENILFINVKNLKTWEKIQLLASHQFFFPPTQFILFHLLALPLLPNAQIL